MPRLLTNQVRLRQHPQTAGWGSGEVTGYRGEIKPWMLIGVGGELVTLQRFPRPLITLGVTGKTGLRPSDTEGRLRLQVCLGVRLGSAPLCTADTGGRLLHRERRPSFLQDASPAPPPAAGSGAPSGLPYPSSPHSGPPCLRMGLPPPLNHVGPAEQGPGLPWGLLFPQHTARKTAGPQVRSARLKLQSTQAPVQTPPTLSTQIGGHSRPAPSWTGRSDFQTSSHTVTPDPRALAGAPAAGAGLAGSLPPATPPSTFPKSPPSGGSGLGGLPGV